MNLTIDLCRLPVAEVAEMPYTILYFVGVVLIVLFGLLALAKKGFGDRIFTRPLTQAAEQAYLFVENMCVSIIGPHGRKYITLIFTLWAFILTANILGLVLPETPSADWSINLGMAVLVIMYVQYEGILSQYIHLKKKGVSSAIAAPRAVLAHFLHFAGPAMPWYLLPVTILILSIELISEAMKMLSLSMRLFANMHGGHLLVSTLNTMFKVGSVPIPAGIIVLPIKLLACIIQALVFTLLTCVYLSLVIHHDDEHEPAQAAQNALMEPGAAEA